MKLLEEFTLMFFLKFVIFHLEGQRNFFLHLFLIVCVC